MCGADCEFIGWLGWLAFLAVIAVTLGWLKFMQLRESLRAQELERRRQRQVETYRPIRFRRRQRFVEIGYSRERVEVLDEPTPPPDSLPGRIKHGNGENVRVDFTTLTHLLAEAEAARRGKGRGRLFA